MKKLLTTILTICIATLLSQAQMTTSSITGVVSDGYGEPLPGAAVVACHVPSGTIYGAVTNAKGVYTILGMRPGGPYTVEISSLGYRAVEYGDVTLLLSQTAELDAVLEDDIEMLAGAVVTATPSSRFAAVKTGASTAVDNGRLESLPNTSRSITSLTRLSPYASGMSFAGSDGRSTNFTVDGANLNNNFGLSASLPGGGTPISLDAIEEIQMVVAPYDVRQSNFVGGGINAITKSGTNKLHGTAYAYYSDEGTRGNSLMGQRIGDRAFEQDKTYGFTLGGPIVKDRLFLFVNMERQKKPEQTIQWRVDDAAKLATLGRISDMLQEGYVYNAGSVTDYPGGTENGKILARLDWNISRDHKLSVRYNNTKNRYWYAPNGNSCDDSFRNKGYNRASAESQPFSNNMYSQQNNVWSVAAELNSRFANVASNDLIATYTSIDDRRGSKSALFPHIDIMTAAAEGSTAPDLSKGNLIPYTSLGYELFSYNNGVLNTVLNIQDNVTLYLGRHTVTAGASMEHQTARNSYMRDGTGYYRFATAEDFLQGNLPVSFAFTYGNNGEDNPAGVVDYIQWGAYLQDEWRAANGLRLTFGVRADMMDFDNGALMTNNAIKAIDYGGRNVDTGYWPDRRVQLSPRLGFNWDAKGDRSLVLRGGFGVFQGRLPLVFFTNMPQNAGMIQTTVKYSASLQDGAIAYSDDVRQALTALNGGVETGGKIATTKEEYISILGLNTTVTEEDGQISKTADVNGVDRAFRMPQIMKGSLAVDYSLPVSFPMTLTVEGMYNKTLWGTRLVNWNIDEEALTKRFAGPDDRLDYRDIPYTYGTNNAYVLTNTNKGWGYTFNLSLDMKPARNLSLTASYTMTESKEISGMPGSNAASAYTGLASVDGPNFLGLQRSRYVVPHKVTANLGYLIERQGLRLDVYYSAYPAYGSSYTYSNDMNGDGIAYDLIYIPKTKDELSFVTEQDRDAFWTFLEQDGYLSRNKGRYAEAYAASAPFLHRIDLRVAKDFSFTIGGIPQDIEVSVSVDNFANMLNSSWGVTRLAYGQSEATGFISPLKYEGVDEAGVPRFSMNKVDGKYPTQTYTGYYKNTSQCWLVLLGIKYIFN